MPAENDILNALKDRYERPRKLAAGTGGVVYRVYDKLLDKDVAIKILLQGNVQERILRFQQEAKAAGKLKHQNVIKVLDFGVVNQDLYLVMECVDGTSLDVLLAKQGRLPLREAVVIFEQIAEGMAHAHSQGVLHRDLKPSNIILVERDGKPEARIVDFGLALLRQDQQSISEGRPVGSPLYMAPEQADALSVDERSDIYSFGCLMCECLTGEPPFIGETALETIVQHQEKTIPRLQDLLPELEVPNEMETIVERCLQKNPDDRFQSMSEVRAALAAVPLPKVIDPRIGNLTIPETEPQPAWSGKDIWERAKTPAIVFVAVSVLAAGLFLVSLTNLFAPVSAPVETAREIEKPDQPEDNMMNDWGDDVFGDRPFAGSNWTYNAIPITDEEFKKLATRKNVQNIFLSIGDARGTGLRYLKDKSKLEALTVYHMNIDSEGFNEIVKFKNLNRLRVRYSQAMTDQDVERLLELPNLQLLYLTGEKLTDKSMNTIGKIKTLRVVSVENMKQITDEGFSRLLGLTDLVGLAIGNTGITEKGLALLPRFKKLRILDVRYLPVTDANINKFVSPDLTALCLRNTAVTLKGIMKLKKCKNLQALDVKGCKLSDADLAKIRSEFKLKQMTDRRTPDATAEFQDDFVQITGRLQVIY